MTFLPEAGVGGDGEGGTVSSGQAGDPLVNIRRSSWCLDTGPPCVNWVCAGIPRVHTLRKGASCMESAGGMKTHYEAVKTPFTP